MERPPRQFASAFRAYVGNLPWQVDDSRLVQLFSEHGEVVNATVVYDRETGRSRGFGFVTMATKDELDDAISALDGQVRIYNSYTENITPTSAYSPSSSSQISVRKANVKSQSNANYLIP